MLTFETGPNFFFFEIMCSATAYILAILPQTGSGLADGTPLSDVTQIWNRQTGAVRGHYHGFSRRKHQEKETHFAHAKCLWPAVQLLCFSCHICHLKLNETFSLYAQVSPLKQFAWSPCMSTFGSDTKNRVTFKTSSTGNSLLVISDSHLMHFLYLSSHINVKLPSYKMKLSPSQLLHNFDFIPVLLRQKS